MIHDNRQVLFAELNSKSDHDPGCQDLRRLYGNNITGFTPEISFEIKIDPNETKYLVAIKSMFKGEILTLDFPPEQVPKILYHLHKIGFFALKRMQFIRKTDEVISGYLIRITELKKRMEAVLSLLQSPEGIKNDCSFRDGTGNT